jgi:hypothetical protein
MTANINIDDQWNTFNQYWDMVHDTTGQYQTTLADQFPTALVGLDQNRDNVVAPDASPLYISTTSMMAKLSCAIDHYTLFWKIPIIPYNSLRTGAVKKQVKLSARTEQEVAALDQLVDTERLRNHISPLLVQILKHNQARGPDKDKHRDIDKDKHRDTDKDKHKQIQTVEPIKQTAESQITLQHERKVSVGISKKDVLHTSKPTQAFYNCIALMFRIYDTSVDEFHEFHVKLCNTGSIEVLGIHKPHHFEQVMHELMATLIHPLVSPDITYTSHGTILVNSNFNCNYLICRDRLNTLLTNTYGLQVIYDPCSNYQGIRCTFYWYSGSDSGCDNDNDNGLGRGSDNGNNHGNGNGSDIQVCRDMISTATQTGQCRPGIAAAHTVCIMIFRTGSVVIVGDAPQSVIEEVYRFLCTIFTTHYATIAM